MSLIDEFLTPEQRWQVTENLKLSKQFFREYLEAPDHYQHLWNGSALVLLPEEDADSPGLTAANMEMAKQAARTGRPVTTHAVGGPLSSVPVRPFDITLSEANPPQLTYNYFSDRLTMTFSEVQTVVDHRPMHELAYALVDPETNRAMQVVVRRVLAEVTPQTTSLIDAVLSRKDVELIGITREELTALRQGYADEPATSESSNFLDFLIRGIA